MSPEFDARRAEAHEKVGALLDEYRDVFGPHSSEHGELDDGLTEISAEGAWAITSFGVVVAWLRLDAGPDDDEEVVRFCTPREVSYPTKQGLLAIPLGLFG